LTTHHNFQKCNSSKKKIMNNSPQVPRNFHPKCTMCWNRQPDDDRCYTCQREWLAELRRLEKEQKSAAAAQGTQKITQFFDKAGSGAKQ